MTGRTKDISKKLLVFLLCLMTVASYSLPTGFGVQKAFAEDKPAAADQIDEKGSGAASGQDAQGSNAAKSDDDLLLEGDDKKLNAAPAPDADQDATSDEQADAAPAPKLAAAPTVGNTRAGAPTITAILVDENGDTVDFSSGKTDQRVAELTASKYVKSTSVEVPYKVSVSVSGMPTGTNLNKQLVVSLGSSLVWGDDGHKLGNPAKSIDNTKGNDGVSTTAGYPMPTNIVYDNPKLGTINQTKTYYLKDGAQTVEELVFEFGVSQHFGGIENIIDGIKISYKQGNNTIVSTKLNKIHDSNFYQIKSPGDWTRYTLLNSYDIGRGAYGYITQTPSNGYFGKHQLVTDDGANYCKITVSNPKAKVFLTSYDSLWQLDTAKSNEAQGMYYFVLRDGGKNVFNPHSFQSNPNYGVYFPSGDFSAGSSVVATEEWQFTDVDPVRTTSTANVVAATPVKGTHKTTWIVGDPGDNRIELQNNTTPVSLSANSQYFNMGTLTNRSLALGYMKIYNRGPVDTAPMRVKMNFGANQRVTWAGITSGVSGIYLEEDNVFKHEMEVMVTTNTNPQPRKFKVTPDSAYGAIIWETGYALRKEKMTLATGSGGRIADNEYLTSIEFDIGTIHVGEPSLIWGGSLLNDVETTTTATLWEKSGKSTDPSAKQGQAKFKYEPGIYKRYYLNPNNDLLNAGTSRNIDARLEIREGMSTQTIITRPIFYVVIKMKDEDGKWLTGTNFKVKGADGYNLEFADNQVSYKDVDGVGRVYMLDTTKIAGWRDLSGWFKTDGATMVAPWVEVNYDLVTTPGTETQTQTKDTMFYVEDGRYAGKTMGIPDGIGRTNSAGVKYNGMSMGTPDNYVKVASVEDMVVRTSAKHESSTDWIEWQDGDAPIAIGTKKGFNIKVDVINGSEKAVEGTAYVYIPIPKVEDFEEGKSWGVLANKGKFGFDIVLDDRNPVKLAGLSPRLSPQDCVIEYAQVIPTDNGNTLGTYNWQSSYTPNTNCIRLTLKNLPANAPGKPDTYSFILNGKVDSAPGTVLSEGLVDTFRPIYYKAIPKLEMWDYGSYASLETNLGEIRGQVFIDANRDGKFQDAEIATMEGVEVSLEDRSGQQVAKADTLADGTYSFKDLKQTQNGYFLRVKNPDTKKYAFTQLGEHSNVPTYNTDNQFTGENNNATGVSRAVTPRASVNGADTVATYNIGFMDADWQTTYTFDANGGQFGTADTLERKGKPGALVSRPANPTREGYTFRYWFFADDTNEAQVTLPTSFGYQDQTFKAKWEKRNYAVTFNTDGGTPSSIDGIAVGYDDAIMSHPNFPSSTSTTNPEPKKAGYNFKGWIRTDITTEEKILTGTDLMPAHNVLLKAKWEERTDYTVRYDANGAPNIDDKTGVKWNQANLEPTPAPVLKGSIFKGWEKPDGNVYKSTDKYSDMAESDQQLVVTLKAIWEPKEYTVNYNTDGGDYIEPKTGVKWEDRGLKPAENPKKTGWTFENWYRNAAKTQLYNDQMYKTLVGNDDTKMSATLYAKFTENEYTVDYDVDGGTPVTSKTGVKWNDANLAPAATDNPTKDGFVFDGWLRPDGKDYKNADKYSDLAANDQQTNVVLKAKWKLKEYTVKYDVNGGTPKPKDKTGVHWTDTGLAPATPPKKAGSTFDGWYYTLNGQEHEYNNDPYSALVTGPNVMEVTLKAKWTAKKYVVNYNTDGGSYVESMTDVLWNQGKLTDGKTTTRGGYTFQGWYTEAGAKYTNQTYADIADDDDDKSILLTARWTQTVYTVKYVTNGGTPATIDDRKVSWSDDNLAPTVAMKKAGCEFDGWYTDQALTKAYNGGAFSTLVPNDTTLTATLYAKWTEKTYKVKFDPNGGSAVANKTVKWADTGLISGVTSTRPGYTLEGWYTQAGAKYVNQAYSALADSESTASITLTAKWTAKSYTVKYETNGGTPKPADKTGVKWEDANFAPKVDPKKSGATFAGWYADAAFQKPYSDGAYSTLVANDGVMTATLYAKWDEGTSYSVRYVMDGGTPVAANKTGVKWGDSGFVPATQPKKDGHTFLGWFRPDGTTLTNAHKYSDIAENDQQMFVVITAKWKARNDYKVTYNVDGGSKVDDKTGVKWDDKDLAPAKDPTKEGFRFDGWYTDQAKSKPYSDGPYSSLVANDSITTATLYAKWTQKTYTVKYDAAGGSAVADKTGVLWTGTGLAPAAGASKRAGYTLDGWYTDGGTKYANQAYSAIANDDSVNSITLTARWTVRTDYKVTYNVDGGSAVPDKTGVKWEQENLTPKDNPTKPGFKFEGWFTDTAKSKPYTGGAYSTLVANDSITTATLYAKFTERTDYIVKYDVDGGTPVLADKTGVKWASTGLAPAAGAVSKKGSTFDGWYFGNTKYTNQAYKDIAENDNQRSITLKAKWIERTDYNVEYVVNGGSAVPKKTGVKWAQTDLVPRQDPTYDGYKFAGWFKDQALANAYNDETYGELAGGNDTVTTVKLYAKWTPIKFDVEFDPNTMDIAGDKLKSEVTGYMGKAVDIKYASGQKAPDCKYYSKGYYFRGWNTNKDGTGIAVADKGDISKLTTIEGKTITLYAQWEVKKYRIKYETQHGKDASALAPAGSKLKVTPESYPDNYPVLWWDDKLTDNKQTDAEKNPSMQEPVEDHSVFGGWYIDDQTFAKKYDGGAYSTVVDDDDNIMQATLYAKWIEITYKTVIDGGAAITPDPEFNRANRPSIGDEITDVNKRWFIIKNITKPDPITGIVIVTVDPITYDFVEGAGQVYTKATYKTGDFMVKRSVNDQKTFGNFKEVKIDGVTVDPANYTKAEGSVKFAFTVDFMESLAVGGHSIEAVFTDGTAQTTFAVAKAATKRTFSHLRAKGTSKSKKSVTVSWLKYKGAVKYEVYGNLCNHKGKEYKYRYLKKAGANTSKVTFKSIHGNKVKKGRYYKFYVKAYDKYGNVVAISKTVHVATKGGKYGNYKSVKLMKPKKAALSLKKGKTYKIKAKELRGNKKVDRHIKIQYESTNTKVATVTKAGKIKAKSKGSCNIFVYAQNGVYKKIKVTVK